MSDIKCYQCGSKLIGYTDFGEESENGPICFDCTLKNRDKLKADLEAANKRIADLKQRQSFAAGNVGLSQIESLERENAILNRMVEAMANYLSRIGETFAYSNRRGSEIIIAYRAEAEKWMSDK